MLNLAAIKDRGLNPTFEDVLVGLKAALDHTGSEDSEERQAIYAIENECRKRQAASICSCGRYIRMAFTLGTCKNCGKNNAAVATLLARRAAQAPSKNQNP